MNNDIQRKRLLKKYLNNQCTQEELHELISYIENTELSEDFPGVEDVLSELEKWPQLSTEADNRIYDQIVAASTKKRKGNFKQTYRVLWAAAVFIGLLFLGYFYKDLFSPPSQTYSPPSQTQITLKMADGRLEEIENTEKIILDSKGKPIGTLMENKLAYDVASKTDSLKYNELSVPYGKTFNLLLADGTSVHLNAGSSIKFPVRFIQGSPREVFLKGEAYFDVERDETHPFIVSAQDISIEVLGTQFSVMSYPEDSSSQVVLVEGSVGMSLDNTSEQIVLTPGQRGVFDKKNKAIVTDEVSTSIYTSWMHGELVFRHMTFEDILKRLERHYNVKIDNQFIAAKEETFNANFGEESIEQVLNYFNSVYDIQYTIEGKNIVIAP